MISSDIEQRAAFDIVRYAQCWEDADILLDALDVKRGDTCLSIASAGDNALALLTRNPERVVAIDLSTVQLYCVALRVAAYRNLSHDQLLQLMGSRPCDDRRALLASCLPNLTPDCAQFWQSQAKAVHKFGIGGVGKFEGYFRLFRRYILPLVHSKNHVAALLTSKDRAARDSFFNTVWNSQRWRLLLSVFFSRPVMGRLGRDPEFFRYAEGGMSGHIARRVAHALVDLQPADNPYLQWILTDRHQTALPLALRPEHFETIRDNLDRLEFRQQSIEDFVDSGQKVDAFNLSDIFEYMSPGAFEMLYRRLLDAANPGARLAYWNMVVPRTCPDSLAGHIKPDPEKSNALHRSDKAFFYSRFVLETVR